MPYLMNVFIIHAFSKIHEILKNISQIGTLFKFFIDYDVHLLLIRKE